MVELLVLILACKGGLWDYMENEGIRKTWYKKNKDIDILFYYGGARDNYVDGDRLFLNCKEWYDDIAKKTILAFEQVLTRYQKLKYVFRTNLSSYVRVDKLKEIANGFNNKQIYAGIIGNHDGIPFASGCGYFISRDLMELRVANKNRLEYSYLDDVCFGKFLTSHGIKPTLTKRFDIVSMEHLAVIRKEDVIDHFHFRCKQVYDRTKDVEVMKKLHSFF